MIKKTSKIFGNIVTVLLVVLLILTIMFTASSRMHNGVPQFFGHKIFVVLSGSMEPKIHTGSIVFVNGNSSKDNLTKGQIVTFKSPFKIGSIITHRIVDVHKMGNTIEYTTKGDSNTTVDPLVIVSQDIIGVYDNVTVPFVGYILSFIQSREGTLLLIIIPSVLLAIWQGIATWKRLGEYEKQKKAEDIADV